MKDSILRCSAVVALTLFFNTSLAQLNIPCTNWLSLPSFKSAISIGDLDIPGNQITVEAMFVRTTPYSGDYMWAGDLVSKHRDPSDVNYLLRPSSAQITTSDGYFVTPEICDIEIGKVYHAAMVYDGTTLKFYRNGFLMSSVPATGSLFQNNYNTKIGLYEDEILNTNLIGYINEVRIWNVARTQNEIKATMNASLNNPGSLPGLKAYYIFDNLINKQGNTTYNGSISGSAIPNSTLPMCSYVSDSCGVQKVDSLIVNHYTPVINYNPCENKLTVENASAFKAGDTVLMIQMKGAIIDSSNSTSFGTITDYKGAGNYEFNYVKMVSGNTIYLENVLIRSYDIPYGKVQLIRIPYYNTLAEDKVLTCLPWDGTKGGVLSFIVKNDLELKQNIDVSGRGFRGGKSVNSQLTTWQPQCNTSTYFTASLPTASQGKGEGVSTLSDTRMSGKGKLANGGGGGNLVNCGGGGGSNGNLGGKGGNQFEGCGSNPGSNGGEPGSLLTYSSSTNKVYLGGGGGAGDSNDPYGTASFQPGGGNGGGIIIISASSIKGNGYSIKSDGGDGQSCTTGNCNEGAGGGGAGGTVLLAGNNYSGTLSITANGGNGANNTAIYIINSYQSHGPGGGGGGGAILFTQSSTPPGVSFQNNGGINGKVINNGNINWGAQAGTNGIQQFNYVLPFSTTKFRKNIDSVRISQVLNSCASYTFTAASFTNTSQIVNWQWQFGDGSFSSTQISSHTFANPGTYTIKLIGLDINGCSDSSTTTLSTNPPLTTPTVSKSNPDCISNTGTINISSPVGSDIMYSINGNTYQASPAFNNLGTGTYTITAKDIKTFCISPAWGGTLNADTIPPAIPTLQVSHHPDCDIVTGSINITNPIGSSLNYSLNNGTFQPNPSYTNLQSGIYSVTVKNTTNGCVSSPQLITINQIPTAPQQPFVGNINHPDCINTKGSFTITQPTGNRYEYILDNGVKQSSPIFKDLASGTYLVIARDTTTHCTSVGTPVTLNQKPDAPFSPVIKITKEPDCSISTGAFSIESPLGNNYEYSLNGIIFQSSAEYTNLAPGNYTVYVRDVSTKCISSPGSISINALTTGPAGYFIPNAFTPNGDGMNDCFRIKNWGVVTSFNLRIFNRWGELVFSSTSADFCWDGTFKGKEAIAGNYVYYIKAITLCGTVEKKGNLILIR